MILFPIQQKAYVSRRDNVDVSKDTTNKDGIMYNLIYLEGQKELPDHCINAGVSFYIRFDQAPVYERMNFL